MSFCIPSLNTSLCWSFKPWIKIKTLREFKFQFSNNTLNKCQFVWVYHFIWMVYLYFKYISHSRNLVPFSITAVVTEFSGNINSSTFFFNSWFYIHLLLRSSEGVCWLFGYYQLKHISKSRMTLNFVLIIVKRTYDHIHMKYNCSLNVAFNLVRCPFAMFGF